MMASVVSILRKALHQLEKERGRIDRQITAIGSVLNDSGTARTPASVAKPSRSKPTRRPMTAAARRAVSQRMKAHWNGARRPPGRSQRRACGSARRRSRPALPDGTKSHRAVGAPNGLHQEIRREMVAAGGGHGSPIQTCLRPDDYCWRNIR